MAVALTLRLALLAACAHLARAQTSAYDEDPEVMVTGSKSIRLQWEQHSTGCTSTVYTVYQRVGGPTSLSQTASTSSATQQLSLNSWTSVHTSSANVLTTELTGLMGCGTMYEFRIAANCDSAGQGELGPISDAVRTPECMSGASTEQCGVRSNGDYKCLASGGDVVYATDIPYIGFQDTQTGSNGAIIKGHMHLTFTSVTTTMWTLEPWFENAISKAVGEGLEDLTSRIGLNATTYVGETYDCSDASYSNNAAYGCSTATGVSVHMWVDCGFNSACVTAVKAAFIQWGNTDATTSQTYLVDLKNRLLYYMNEDTYDYINQYEDTTEAALVTYSAYNTLTVSALTISAPTDSARITESTCNPLSSAWASTVSGSASAASHPLFHKFEFPCGIQRNGEVECQGYYDQWVDSEGSTYRVARQVAPAYRQRKFKMISSDKLRTCGITHADILVCWGYTQFGSYTESLTGTSLVFPCGWTKQIKDDLIEDELIENQNDIKNGDTPRFAEVRLHWRWKWVSVGGGSISGSTYKGTVCMVRQDGKARCNGCNEALGVTGNLDSEMPDDIDEWEKIEVATDGTWAVGWATNGEARAWGQKGVHPIIPEGVYFRDIPSIIASTNHVVCGLQASDGKLLCFGHYNDANNRKQEISRIFSNGDNFATYAATADANTGSGYGSSTNMRCISRGGCANVYNSLSTAECIKSWDGYDGSGTTKYGTTIGPATLSAGTTDYLFLQAPGVPYSLTSGTYDDDLVAAASTSAQGTATLSFKAPTVTTADGQEAIAGYQVYVKGGARRRRRRGSKYKMMLMTANTNSDVSLTVDGLLPDEKYKFKVRAYSKASGYMFSALSDSSNSIYTIKGTPNLITTFWWDDSQSADDYVMLLWQNPQGSGLTYDLTYYQVSYKLSTASSYSTTNIYPRTDQSQMEDVWVQEWFNGLTAGTSYNFKVAACNAVGCGTASSVITATTNFTQTVVEYQVKTNITFISQWCSTDIDCGYWITADSWTSTINSCFIDSIVYWLQWHSTYMVEYENAWESYNAYAPTPAPSLGAVGDISTTVPVVDQVDWENVTSENCDGGAANGCYQPTAQPTFKPEEQISSDGYYNDPAALNGTAPGSTGAFGSSNVNIESDSNYDMTLTNTSYDTSTGATEETTYKGTNVVYDVTTDNEYQADSAMSTCTNNDGGETDAAEDESFSNSFTTVARDSYSSYTGSTTSDSTSGGYEAKSTSDSNPGIMIALLAAIIVIIMLLIFILHGWYKRAQLKKYMERRAIVQDRFLKAKDTITTMRKLGTLTEILKANETAFSYQNLKDTHKDVARNLKDVFATATDSASASANAFDEQAEIERMKNEYMLSQEYQNASLLAQRRLMEDKIAQRKSEMRARRKGSALQDDAVRDRVVQIIEEAAEDKNFKVHTLNEADEAELQRLKEETEKSAAYLDASEFERRELMRAKLEERRKKLLDDKQKNVSSGEQVLDNDVVDTIIERASASLMQQLQAEAFDEEAELARLKSEYERSNEYLSAAEEDKKALMRAKIDARKQAIRVRQARMRQSKPGEEGEEGDNVMEIAQIVSKVEANVADACDAQDQASEILQQFQAAESEGAKNSAEARESKKAALQERLRARREARAQALDDLRNSEMTDAERADAQNELIDLPEKWQEVEDDLVEQALCAYEIELENKSLDDGQDAVTSRVQEAALAKIMWQLDRDIAHAEELRNNEWASSEAANILKRYEQAAKQSESNIKVAQDEQKNHLKKRLERRRMLRVQRTASTMWEKLRMQKPHETTTVAQVLETLEGGHTMDI